MADNLRAIPLGGLGEIGKNMMALELADDLILIDAGLMFPDEEMLGVDLVIPYVLPRLRLPNGKMPPIYCTRLTRGLIAVKLEEHRLDKQADLRIVRPGERVKLGRFNAEFIHITHSIPDSAALAIQTPAGTVFHTGDFKFDHTPVMGEPPDLTRIAEIGRRGVVLLFSDSTYADTTGYTPSERSVSETLDRIMANASGRVIVATFASLISRIQQVIDAAIK